ncbi:MAG: hypothetical protein K0R10_1844 [Alphaproteobacteria bacterium]|nr:hypothetical protein [Alphaproteobacteria bacterium]
MFPQFLARGTATAQALAGKRVDNGIVVTQRKMKVWEFGKARLPDLSQLCAFCYRLAHRNRDAAFFHVAIFSDPFTCMKDGDKVAAFFLRLFGGGEIGGRAMMIVNIVSHTDNFAIERSKDVQAALHCCEITHSDICAIMSVIGQMTAMEILRGWRCILIDMVDHPAILAFSTGDGPAKARLLGQS